MNTGSMRASIPAHRQIQENHVPYNSHDQRRPFWVPSQTIPHYANNQAYSVNDLASLYNSHPRQSYQPNQQNFSQPNVRHQNVNQPNISQPNINQQNLVYQNSVNNPHPQYRNNASHSGYRNNANVPIYPNKNLPQQKYLDQKPEHFQQQNHYPNSDHQYYHYKSAPYPEYKFKAFPGAHEKYEEIVQDQYPLQQNAEGQNDLRKNPRQASQQKLESPFRQLSRSETSKVDDPFNRKTYSAGDSESTCPPYTDSASSSPKYSPGRRPKRRVSKNSGSSSRTGSRKTSWAPSLFTDTDRASEIKAEKEILIEDIVRNDEILYNASNCLESASRTSSPVYLRVYDLTEGMAEKISSRLSSSPVEAIYHTGIHVFGFEYFFGAGILKKLTEDVEEEYAMSYLRSEHLGNTNWTIQEFEHFLTRIRDIFHPTQYDLLNWNCNDFTNVCAKRLLGDDFGIPQYIINQPVDANESALGKAAILGFKFFNKNIEFLGNFEAAFEKIRSFVEEKRLNWAARARS